MKHAMIFALLCSTVLAGELTSTRVARADPPPVRTGTVTLVGSSFWTVTPAGQPTERYCLRGPLATGAMQLEGVKVQFSGTPEPIPPNVRMACSPFAFDTLKISS